MKVDFISLALAIKWLSDFSSSNKWTHLVMVCNSPENTTETSEKGEDYGDHRCVFKLPG